jgi:hypothetical protein
VTGREHEQDEARLDELWPEWREMRDSDERTVGSRVIERTSTGWSTWQPHLRQHNERREIGGYSRDTGWSLSDLGLIHELEDEVRRGGLVPDVR